MTTFVALGLLALALVLALQPGLWPGALVVAVIALLLWHRSRRQRPRRVARTVVRRPRRGGAFRTPRHEREGGND